MESVEKMPSIKKNFAMNALLAMSNVLFPLITFPYVSRILLPEGLGKVTFGLSLISYFSMFAQLGIPTYGIRVCAQVRDDRTALSRTVHELLRINLIMNLICYLAFAVVLITVPRLREERLLYVILSSIIFLNSVGMEWLYKGLEQYTYITVRSLAFKAVALVATFLLIHSRKDYILYGVVQIMATSASNLLNLYNSRKYIDWRCPAGWNLRKHIRPTLVFFSMTCAITVYTNLDALMLGFMTTDTDVGYYAAAVKVKLVLVSVVTSLGAVLLPRSAYFLEHGQKEKFEQISRKAMRFVIVAAAGLTLYFMLYAKECILFLSGAEFDEALLPMQIIMPTVLLIGITNLWGAQMLIPLGKENVVLRSVTAGAVTDLVLNAVLIPRFHAAGASMGTLAAEAVVLIVQYMGFREAAGPMIRSYNWGRLTAALLAGTAACLWVKRLEIHVFPALVISSICFFVCYGLFLLWRKDETVTEIWGMVKAKII